MKKRMTITLSDDAAGVLDNLAREAGRNRSRMAEDLIREGMKQRRRRTLERLAARFFAGEATAEEVRERDAWDRLAQEALRDDD